MKTYIYKIPPGRNNFGLRNGQICDELPSNMSDTIKNLYAKEGWVVPFEDFLPGVAIPDIASIPEPCDVTIVAREQKLPMAFIDEQEVVTNGFALSLLPPEFIVKIIQPEYKEPMVKISGINMPTRSGCQLAITRIGETTITILVPVIRSRKANTVMNLLWTKVIGKLTFTDERGVSVVVYELKQRAEEAE